MEANATLNEVYLELMKACPCWTLINFALIYTFIAMFGIVMNFFVVYVTIRTKHFDSSANKLLAIYSSFEIIHQFGHFLFAFNIFSGNYLMPYKMAVRMLIPSYFAFCCTTYLLFFTSIDRLIYVIFPLKNHKNVFIYGITLPIVGICGSFLVYIINTKPVDDLISSGSMIDAVLAPNSPQHIYLAITYEATTILFLLATVSIYVLLAILLRFQTASSNSNWHQFNIRIFRSLFIIVSVNIGGYLLIALTLVTRTIFEFDLLAKWKFAHIIGILLNISAASNAPILYFNSQEYRKAFDKELQNIAKICKRNAVQP